jgi:hypothetical protein
MDVGKIFMLAYACVRLPTLAQVCGEGMRRQKDGGKKIKAWNHGIL